MEKVNWALDILRSSSIFSEFTNEELQELVPFASLERFEEGEWIFHEGDLGSKLYIIKEGRVEALKKLGEFSEMESIGVLGPDETFGEMAFLEQKERSASVRTLEPTLALVIYFDQNSKDRKLKIIESKISGGLLRNLSHRLRKTDEILIESLRKKLEISTTHEQVSKVLTYTFVLMSFILVSEKAVMTYLLPYASKITFFLHPIFLLIIGICSLVVMQKSPYPWKFYGVTLDRWPRHALEGVLFSIPILAILLGIKWFIIENVPQFEQLPLFHFDYQRLDSIGLYVVDNLVYLLLVPMQELVVRGLLQNCFRNFYEGKKRGFLAILTSNLTFLILHTAVGVILAVGSFFLGVLWGILYERQKSLVGVTISHMLIGWAIFFLLNFYSVVS